MQKRPHQTPRYHIITSHNTTLYQLQNYNLSWRRSPCTVCVKATSATRTSSLATVRTSSTIQLRCYGPILSKVSIRLKSRYYSCLLYHNWKAPFLCWKCWSRYLYISDHFCLRGPFLHGLHCYVRFVRPSTMTKMTRPTHFCLFMKYIFVVGVNCHVLSVHPFFLLLCFKLNFVSKNLLISSCHHLNISQWHICALSHIEPRSE